MLRRYLIVNATMTLVPYGVFLAFAPSAPHLLQSVRATFDTFSMESPMLRPLFHRIVSSAARWQVDKAFSRAALRLSLVDR